VKFLKFSILAVCLAAGSSTIASASDNNEERHAIRHPDNTAPEIDPGVAFGSLSMLGGTLVVLRSRRRR
jgi:hypothetical protein